MITLTIRFKELKSGHVDVDGQCIHDGVTAGEVEALGKYDMETYRSDMRRIADAALNMRRKQPSESL
jgi:hypothetical protein